MVSSILKKNIKKTGVNIVFYVTIIALFLFFVFPILWTIMTAFKPKPKVFESPPSILFEPTFANFEHIFSHTFVAHYLLNSFVVAISTTILSVGIGVLAAYSLGRLKFKGSENLAFYILSIRMFPPIAAAIPLFLIMRNLRLLDTRIALIVAHLTFNLPFAVWMLRSFIEGIPPELEEAVLVDGGTRMHAFWNVTLPLLLPSIAAVSILCFIFSWNEFLFALILTSREAKTLTIGISEFITFEGIGWHNIFATISVLIIPVLVLASIMQRYLVRGLTMGAIRG